MKIQIKKNPHNLETKQGNSQMGSEKQPMTNQDEWKLLQLDWKTKFSSIEHFDKTNSTNLTSMMLSSIFLSISLIVYLRLVIVVKTIFCHYFISSFVKGVFSIRQSLDWKIKTRNKWQTSHAGLAPPVGLTMVVDIISNQPL